MNNKQSFEEQLWEMIADTKAELATKEENKVALDRDIALLKNELQGYNVTLASYQKRSGTTVEHHDGIDWPKLMIDTQTHKDEIVVVLKQLGGIARPNQITDILFREGFIKSKKRANAYQIVQNNLADLIEKGLVEKTETGEYKLLGAQPFMMKIA